jgi:hypothetical protein
MRLVSSVSGAGSDVGQPAAARQALNDTEEMFMAHGLDSTKSAARPSHEAIEGRGSGDELTDHKSKNEKLDVEAMRGAKRAQNRILNNEENIPGSTEFTK